MTTLTSDEQGSAAVLKKGTLYLLIVFCNIYKVVRTTEAQSTGAPASIKIRVMSTKPPCAAKNSAVVPV
jgi:hypothetical protein